MAPPFPMMVMKAFLQRKGRLSDIEFLAIKEFGGKLVTNVSEQLDGGTGNAASLTASSGKDLYLVKGSVIITQDATSASQLLADIDLIANSVVIDTIKVQAVGGSTTGPYGPQSRRYDFVVQGIKVAATETIVIDVIASDADFDIIGTLVGFEETTGESPAI